MMGGSRFGPGGGLGGGFGRMGGGGVGPMGAGLMGGGLGLLGGMAIADGIGMFGSGSSSLLQKMICRITPTWKACMMARCTTLAAWVATWAVIWAAWVIWAGIWAASSFARCLVYNVPSSYYDEVVKLSILPM